MLLGLVAWVGRILRGEDRGTVACSVGEMLGEGVGLDLVEACKVHHKYGVKGSLTTTKL